MGTGHDGGQLTQGLAHQAGLQSHVGVSHFAFQLRLGNQCGHAVNHNDIHPSGTHQDFGDLQRLLPEIGLGHVEFVDINPQLFSIYGVQRMLSVNKSGISTGQLRFSNRLQRHGGLAG